MIKWHKVAMILAVTCLIAANLYARSGVSITWSYKGHWHSETAEYVQVLTPSGRNDDRLIPVEDSHSHMDTGQRVQARVVNAYCVPWYRGLAEGNLFLIFGWMAIVSIVWVIDHTRAKRHASRADQV